MSVIFCHVLFEFTKKLTLEPGFPTTTFRPNHAVSKTPCLGMGCSPNSVTGREEEKKNRQE